MDACTLGEQCKGGACIGASKLKLAIDPPNKDDPKGCDDGNVCTIDTCDSKTGACDSNTPAAAGASCSDGDKCTLFDKCDGGGVCVGTPLACQAKSACGVAACEASTGTCKETPKADGDGCDDGNKCTEDDACAAGKCVGKALVCNDDNPCTKDACQPGAGCIYIPISTPNTKCNDNDACTQNDVCDPTGKCSGTPLDCKDNNPCTNDSCDATKGGCVHDEFVGPCDDGNKCTESDTCVDGKCTGQSVNCDDKNSCTTDACDTKLGCLNKPAPGGTKCDDGLSCTTGDYCDSGKCKPLTDSCTPCNSDLECASYDDKDLCNGTLKCVPANPANPEAVKVCSIDPKTVVKCDASADTPCKKNTCEAASGLCSVVTSTDGQSCLPTDKCVKNATCQAGQCAGKALDCNDNNVCTDDSCDPKVGVCIHANNAGLCDDSNSCTVGETCKDGQCVSPPSQCACPTGLDSECTQYDDGDKCNGVLACVNKFCAFKTGSVIKCITANDTDCSKNKCDPKEGKCKATPEADATQCDDKNFCTSGEACMAGLCTGGAPLNCDDKNACTDDVCDPTSGCLHGSKTGVCNDGNACTTGDKCTSGTCTGAPVKCDDKNPCTQDVCAKTGGCTYIVDDALPCDDSDPCTTDDHCDKGVCKSSQGSCDDKNPCTADSCEPGEGCKHVIISGKTCDDGDKCTVNDFCSPEGVCGGSALKCEDGNECTLEACVNGVCVVQAANGKECDDGNACTDKDTCNNGQCAGKQKDCNDSNPCTAELGCSPKTGCIQVQNDAIPCNDNDACTFEDKCQGGACLGKSLNCDDKNPCTNDVCDKVKGCVITQNPCDDKNPCTADKCVLGAGCQNTPLDGVACDDGDACTAGDMCNIDQCVGKPKTCDDKNVCTEDSCDPKTGCAFVNLPLGATPCDDGNACTDDACDGKGKCLGKAIACDDGNSCTTDSCNPLTGCAHSDATDNTVCDDDNECTGCKPGVTCSLPTAQKDHCVGGICTPGALLNCGICPSGKDSECNGLYDNGNLCDGQYFCVKGICHLDKNPVVCDGTLDTDCNKNQCNILTGKCEQKDVLNGSKCSDTDPCTVNDICIGGQCTSGPPADCSTAADDCNKAECKPNITKPSGYECVQLPKEGTVTCNADNTGCTVNDTCEAGVCKPGTTVDCSPFAKQCEVAACKSTGNNAFTCDVTKASDGSKCDDSQLCTVGDACKGGLCIPGTKPLDCSSLNGTCATGSCDPKGNGGTGLCIPMPKNEGATCNSDDNGCTTGDACFQGLCQPGQPPDCTAQNDACNNGACQSLTATSFKCTKAPKPKGTVCEADSNGCTLDDHCDTGACVPGKQKDCTAFDQGCLKGMCQSLGASAATCLQKPAPTGTACDADSNGCTKDDVCNAEGACEPGNPVNCLAFTNGCATGTCKSTGANTFVCQGSPLADGTPCDADQTGCTKDDTCMSGKCVPGGAVDCSALTAACVKGTCKTTGSDTFECQGVPLADGGACDADQSGCTTDDACVLGVCAAGEIQTCAKFKDTCNDAACKSTGNNSFQCDKTPKPAGLLLDPTDYCFSEDPCPTGYDCKGATEKKGTAACNPAKPCAGSDTCVGYDATTKKDGVCWAIVFGSCEPKVAPVACDNGDGCTVGDFCKNGVCTPGKAVDCDDKDLCTSDSCSVGACKHAAIPNCATCIDEGFELTKQDGWIPVSEDVTWVSFGLSDKSPKTGASFLRAQWPGPVLTATTPGVSAEYRYKRLYVRKGLALLDLQYRFTPFNQGCGQDDFKIIINGANTVFERCDSTVDDWNHLQLDLSKYSGTYVDLTFQALAGTSTEPGQESAGVLDIDDVKLVGDCSVACAGNGFDLLNDTRPLPTEWDFASTASTYMSWKRLTTEAFVGPQALQVAYTGAPPGSKQQTASFKMKNVTVDKGAALNFALKVPNVGDTSCNNDSLFVRVNTVQVYKACTVKDTWTMVHIPLDDYAGQTVAIEFQVVSGVDSSSKGTFIIDEVAIEGTCTYECYHATFDKDFTDWQVSSGDPNQLKWVWQGSVFKTAAGAASIVHTKKVIGEEGRVAILAAGDPNRWAIPINGAMFSVAANLSLNGADGQGGRFIMELAVNPTPLTDAPTAKPGISTDGNVKPVTEPNNTSGWKTYKGDVDATLNGLFVRPTFIFTAGLNSVSESLYVDDVFLFCR